MENMSVVKLLLKLSPPVMLALLIQSIYNIVDSFFISRYSAAGMAHNAGEGGSAPAGPAEAIGTRAGSVNKL